MLLNIEPINEVYFGKTPEMQRIENQLGKFRSKYMGKYLMQNGLNSDPDLLLFNRMMEEQFGFGCFSLHITSQMGVNAFTISLDCNVMSAPGCTQLVADKRTFKFNKKADYTCMVFIYTGILFNEEFTTEECMAIIMHEVGHNFYCALNHRFGVLNKVFYTYLFFVDILRFSSANDLLNFALMTDIGKVYKKFEKYCRDNKVIIINLIDTVENCYSLYKTVEGVFDNIKDKLTLGLMTLLGASIITAFKMFNIWTWLFLPLSLNNEKTADNFATIYGYGPALSSALNKLETASPSELDKAFDKIPFLSNLYSINTSLAYIIIGGIDGHPETVTRMYDQLELLKREANKEDLDPKMRKVILKDIADCEKIIKETITLNDGIKDKELVSKLYSKFLYDNLKSKRLKDMIFDDRLRFSGYDKVYDRALKK